ncbi:hypothetical protein L208DRAFT_1263665 [Tricholoma matsutake]|nr:hypothetical protein L208DRAFT_1263665 [Tricholoma matsutake 945]
MSTTQYSAGVFSQPKVACLFIEAGVTKHNTRIDILFLKAFMAGVLLSFWNLLSEMASTGSPTFNASNPGLVKLISGFVCPIGLVMIVLNSQELLTSNMLIFPMAVWKRVVPWWGLPYNWLVVFFGNLVGSLFFCAILVQCMYTVFPFELVTGMHQ